MKVYYEVLPATLGRAMHRIRKELCARIPEGAELVAAPKDADMQVLDVIGGGSLQYLADKPYAILQHCIATAGMEWKTLLSLWDGAKAVVSPLAGVKARKSLRVPFGVDGGAFYRDATPSIGGFGRVEVLSTGYCDEGESIRECWDAAERAIHVGRLDATPEHVESYEDVSDDDMRRLYSDTHYVSGLRRIEGFELPIIEGLACGARPICYDLECYRHWFQGHAILIPPELPREELVARLKHIFATRPKPVDTEERCWLLHQFSWDRIAKQF